MVSLSRMIFSLYEMSNFSGRTTIGLIASDIGVDQSVVREQIKHVENVQFFQSEDNVICEKEVKKLTHLLVEETQAMGARRYLPFCSEHQINYNAVEYFTKIAKPELVISRELVVLKLLFDSGKKNLVNKLQSSETPLSLNALPAESGFNAQIWDEIIQTASKWLKDESPQGNLDRDNVFTPFAYREKQQTGLVEKLRNNGTIKSQEFSATGIKDGVKFCKNQGLCCAQLKAIIYTDDFLLSEVQKHQAGLESKGWSSIKYEMPLTDEEQFIKKCLIPQLQGRLVVTKERTSTYAISTSFLNSLVSKINSHFSSLVEQTVDATFKANPKIASESVATIVSKIVHGPDGPSEASLGTFLNVQDDDLRRYLMKRCLATVRDEFSSSVKTLVESKLSALEDDATRKQLVYFNGVDSIRQYDAKTAKALDEELLTKYAHRPTIQFEKEALDITRKQLVDRLRQQLKAAQEPALVLHLAVLIAHSDFFSQQTGTPGVLKASGKYVPKLLKILKAAGFPQDEKLIELKQAISQGSKEETTRLRVAVKELISKNE